MWSFGSRKAEQTQTPAGKTSDGSNHQTTPGRSNGDPGQDQQQPQHQQLSPKGGGSLAAKSRMFYKNKKLSSSSHASSSTKSNPKPPGTQPRTPQQEMRKKRYFGGGSGNRRKSVSNTDDDYLQDVNVNETSNGIEVSFPGNESTGTAPGSKGKSDRSSGQTPVISLKEQIRERQRVFKSQFSTVLPASNNNTINAKKWKPKGHRIPLLGIAPADAGYSDTLNLLKSSPILDERTAVKQELSLMETEISSLERDRMWLEQSVQNPSSNLDNTNRRSDSSSVNKENVAGTWNAHKLLKDDANKEKQLPASERIMLQKQRGNYLTAHLSNNRIEEMFVLTFGGKRSTLLFRNDESIITMAPSNSSALATGTTTLQHLSLISSTSKAASNGGLYFSQDSGKSLNIGQLPNKLSQRFEGSELDLNVGDLVYLSTGSCGCYFAKFQSGECWWGSALEDAEFQMILNAWDVYRVAFGEMKTSGHGQLGQQVSKSNNKATLSNSWIILSHDGKAAWKNLPSRLSKKLEMRSAKSTAPVEVSLGPGDSYFVRFLDGSIDYSLPSKIARVCERIEERGGNITSISLHPDISHDFVIRHTELSR